MIQKTVNKANEILHSSRDDGTLTKKVLAVGIEINQLYTEYLDGLLDSDLSVDSGVTVEVDGRTIRFPDNESFSRWLAENMT